MSNQGEPRACLVRIAMNVNGSSMNERQSPMGTAKPVTTENLESALFASTMFTNTPTNHVRLNHTHRSALRDAALTGTIAEGRGIFPASSVWSVAEPMNKGNHGKPRACSVRIAMITKPSPIVHPLLPGTGKTGTRENHSNTCFGPATLTNTITAMRTAILLASLAILFTACTPEAAAPEVIEAPARPNWVYFLADGTDVEDQRTAIPHLDTAYMAQVIDLLLANGGGKVWLNWVDAMSGDNEALYLDLPVVANTWSKPERKSMESEDDYRVRLRALQPDSIKHATAYQRSMDRIAAKRARFLADAQRLLETVVYPYGHKQHRQSDVHGAMNNAYRVLSGPDDVAPAHKLILGFSDLWHFVGKSKPIALDPIPADVEAIIVYPNADLKKVAVKEARIMEHPDRAMELIEDAIIPAP